MHQKKRYKLNQKNVNELERERRNEEESRKKIERVNKDIKPS